MHTFTLHLDSRFQNLPSLNCAIWVNIQRLKPLQDWKKKKKKSNNAFVQVSRDCHGVISADSLVQISHHPVTIPNLLQLCISESDPCLYNLTNSSKTRGVPYSWQLMSYLKILVQTLLSIFPQAEISPQENHGHDLALNSWSLLQSTTYSTSIL